APGITVILFKRTESGLIAYGHAAAGDFVKACRKAAVEMERRAQSVAQFARLSPDAHPIERRSVFFSQAEGHALFLERLGSRPAGPAPVPRVVYDGPVPGPWAKYADVWRVVYEPPSRRFLGTDETYFML
ncbi:MAG: hypothetical protein H7X89_16010, partial [Rhizobiales bacterium]|nr:hypothetical protein [Hyphomicrobiales bacterium]